MTTTDFTEDDAGQRVSDIDHELAAAHGDVAGESPAPRSVWAADGASDAPSSSSSSSSVAEDDPAGDEGWEEDEALPPPRGKLMTPLTWILVVAVFAGGGFALGTKMEKTHATSVAQAAVTAQIAALRNRAGGGGAGAGGGGFGGAPGGGFAGGAGTGAGTGGSGGATGTGAGTGTGAAPASAAATGTVKLVDGDKVYVQDAAGNVIIVTAGAGVAVTQSAAGTLADLKAGQTVVVQGTTNADGTVTATAIVSSPAGATTPAGATSSAGATTPNPVVAANTTP